jgi:4-amino-4-deoxy-L-arabinose transferase-like glycosyltransferase
MEIFDLDRSALAGISAGVATNLFTLLLGLYTVDTVVDINLPLELVHLAALTAVAFAFSGILLRFPGEEEESVEDSEPDGFGLTQRHVMVALGVLVVAGAVLRLYALGEQSFWFDEAITTNAAIGFLEHGKPMFPSGYVYWRSFPHTVLVATSMAVFGISEWAARLPSVIFGVATIPVTYLLGRQVGDRRVGLLAAALMTFLTWEITWGRQARMYQQLQFFYTVALYGLARIEHRSLWNQRALATTLVGVVGAGITHQIGLVLVPVSALILVICLWTGTLLTQISQKRVAVYVGGILLTAGALELLSVGLHSVVLRVLAGATGVVHVDRYVAWLQTEFGLIFILSIVGLGLAYRQSLLSGLLLSSAVLLPFWVLSYRTPLFARRYLFFAVPVSIVLFMLAVQFVCRQVWELYLRFGGVTVRRITVSKFSPRKGDSSKSVVVVGVVLVTLLLMAPPTFTLGPTAHYSLGPNAPQPDFAGAYEYVNDRAAEGDVIIVGWTAPALYYHGEVEYWMAHSLTNRRPASSWVISSGQERYSNATPVYNETQLRRVVCNGTGWAVLDSISYRKMSSAERSVLSQAVRHESRSRNVRVYSWNESTCAR